MSKLEETLNSFVSRVFYKKKKWKFDKGYIAKVDMELHYIVMFADIRAKNQYARVITFPIQSEEMKKDKVRQDKLISALSVSMCNMITSVIGSKRKHVEKYERSELLLVV